MRLSLAAATTAWAVATQAYTNTSPFALLSSAQLKLPPSDSQLQTASAVTSEVTEMLASCPTEKYLLVSLPGVSSSDIRMGGLGNLRNLWRDAASTYSVSEVVGQLSGASLVNGIERACVNAGKTSARVERVDLVGLSNTNDEATRKVALKESDHELGKLFDTLDKEYTVIVISDPTEYKSYEPSFSEPSLPGKLHGDLKRWTEDANAAYINKRAGNSTNLPLFEKYQFFTPGVFMGLLALIIILSILGVGVKALASLEVPYGAFDKEMGPAAQKKQQ